MFNKKHAILLFFSVLFIFVYLLKLQSLVVLFLIAILGAILSFFGKKNTFIFFRSLFFTSLLFGFLSNFFMSIGAYFVESVIYTRPSSLMFLVNFKEFFLLALLFSFFYFIGGIIGLFLRTKLVN